MRRRLASHRFRRRALWGAALVGALAGIVVPAVLLGNTAKQEPERLSGGRAWVYRAPKLARLAPAERARLLETSIRFVRTAVARQHLDEAYDLAGPELRQGMSKREWMRGNIPVVPFPAAGVAQWDLSYSYENDVAFQLSLLAKPGSSSVVGKTFTIELVRRTVHSPWKVVSWVPVGVSGPGNDTEIAAQQQALDAQRLPAPLARWWLALPVGVLALVVLVPIGLGVRSWLAGRRADRRYRAERGF
jgi:hypothetical protein